MWPSLLPVSPPASARLSPGFWQVDSQLPASMGTPPCIQLESFGQWIDPLPVPGLPLLHSAWRSMMGTHQHSSFELPTFLLLWLSCTITDSKPIEPCVRTEISLLSSKINHSGNPTGRLGPHISCLLPRGCQELSV